MIRSSSLTGFASSSWRSAPRQGLLGRLGQNIPHPLGGGDPAEQARRIVDTMAESLVRSLGEQGLSAQRLGPTTGELPQEGWLLQGEFTEVDEGNRLKRAGIGFGSGATRMDVQVGISDLAGPAPRTPFIVFGTVKDPGKLPGAALTMNPYVAAAKFVLEKNAGERDIQKTADRIVAEILKSEETIEQQSRLHGGAPR